MELNSKDLKNTVYKILEEGNGILKLKPTWVARKNCPSGKRLGLKEEDYDKGERGEITERWIASTTEADNMLGPEDEGLSYLYSGCGYNISLKQAIKIAKDLILGIDYSRNHDDTGVLVKVLDYDDRIYYHYHQTESDAAAVGKHPKEEAYYFPEDTDLGLHPESFYGLHPYIAEQKKYDILLPYLEQWNSDLILKHSKAYTQARDDGFHLPAGIPHSPGTALTVEIQEDSDVYSVLQALYRGTILPKDMLFHNMREEDIKKFGEKMVLKQLDWEKSADPYFYENRHIPPIPLEDSKQIGGNEHWIIYNTSKFSAKKLVVYPGQKYETTEKGIYSVLAWKGNGKIDGHFCEGGNPGFDEFLVVRDRAVKPVVIENTGPGELKLFKFFGPGINLDTPMLVPYYNK
ncbi:MAG: hypothetical protein JW770_07025 [Actinobacteria bacterium]|nr:hypothetical protein [Actinomycetota bacterium]